MLVVLSPCLAFEDDRCAPRRRCCLSRLAARALHPSAAKALRAAGNVLEGAERVSFSGITQYRRRRLLDESGLQEGQAALPESIRCFATDVEPHKWTHRGEVSESPDLLKRPQREVCSAGSGRPALGNCFMDVQSLNSSGPMTRRVSDSKDELTVSGVPDLAILERGLDASTVVSPFSNTCAVVDWKPPDKVGMPKAGWQVMTQAIVLAGDDGNASPAFVTASPRASAGELS